MDKRTIVGTYFRQQAEMAMPDAVIDATLISRLVHPHLREAASAEGPSGHTRSEKTATPAGRTKAASNLKSRLASLRPVDRLANSALKLPPSPSAASIPRNNVSSGKLFMAGCTKCPLAASRTKFVFGAGNADAPVMIIGEAPGQEEDEQGLPFVGAAGKLLTSMLAAINIDRTTDVFITNVLKCHPPQNRNPETAEIVACLPMLKRQIDILQPKAILLLGRIAAHALLDISDSIAKMRLRTFDFNGISTVVTYHPAALLRNADYKRPAWEDLQRFRDLLSTAGVYGSLHEK